MSASMANKKSSAGNTTLLGLRITSHATLSPQYIRLWAI